MEGRKAFSIVFLLVILTDLGCIKLRSSASDTRLAEALLLIGGGTPEGPERSGVLLRGDGSLCLPVGTNSVELDHGLYGPGVARVDGGFVVCGGGTITGGKGINKKCWFWDYLTGQYELLPNSSSIPIPFDDIVGVTGSVVMTNDYLSPKRRSKIFLWVEDTNLAFVGIFEYHAARIQWTAVKEPFPVPPASFSKTSLRRNSCGVMIQDSLFLIGGETFSHTSDFGITLNMEMLSWETFPLLMPPRHSMACALDVRLDSKRVKMEKNVLWIAGGMSTRMENGTAVHEMSDQLDTLNLNSGQWTVGEAVEILKLSQPRINATMAILSDGRRRRLLVLSCDSPSCSSSSVDVLATEKLSYSQESLSVDRRAIKRLANEERYVPKLFTKYGSAVLPLKWFPSCAYENVTFQSAANTDRGVYITLVTTLLVLLWR